MAAFNDITTLLITTARLIKALSPHMSNGGISAYGRSLGTVIPRAWGKYPHKDVNPPNSSAIIRLVFAH